MKKKKRHPLTYLNFSARVGSGETEIFLIMASGSTLFVNFKVKKNRGTKKYNIFLKL